MVTIAASLLDFVQRYMSNSVNVVSRDWKTVARCRGEGLNRGISLPVIESAMRGQARTTLTLAENIGIG
jgi:hypothetical protein